MLRYGAANAFEFAPATVLRPGMSLLVTAPDDAQAQALAASLRQAGVRLAGACACSNLVREAVRLAPEVVLLACPALDAALLAQLRLLAGGRPLPVLVASDGTVPAQGQDLLDAGIWAWLPADCQPGLLAQVLPLAQARWAAQRAGDAALADALARLDERKWVERAKGLLMRDQQLSESDAFSLLRTASMHTNLRVGEVSRGLIEAAQAAEAVNRAGQLRMLSQRLVKALALWVADADRAAAADQLADCHQRLQDNLDLLAQALPGATPGAGPAEALLAWQGLRQQVQVARQASAPAAALAALAAADDRAEALLVAADALTAALEHASGRQGLRVVNLCGRQRMLVQRLAKQAVLQSCLGGAAAAAQAEAAVATRDAFAQALQLLQRAPLANDEIRALLAEALAQWQRLLQGVQRLGSLKPGAAGPAGPGAPAALRTVSRESEALLTSFDRLTSVYEHSLQVLLG